MVLPYTNAWLTNELFAHLTGFQPDLIPLRRLLERYELLHASCGRIGIRENQNMKRKKIVTGVKACRHTTCNFCQREEGDCEADPGRQTGTNHPLTQLLLSYLSSEYGGFPIQDRGVSTKGLLPKL